MAETIHFKNLVNIEITRLMKLCDYWSNIFSKGDTPEEEKGNILSIIGQTNLLIKEKIKQFTNLIQIYETNDSTQKITYDDLQGFWDLITLQIEDVNSKYIKLELKQSNRWKPIAETIENNDIIKRKTRKMFSNKALDDAAKLRLNAAKAAMKERLKN